MIRVNGAVSLLFVAIGIWTCRFRRSAIGVSAFSSSRMPYNVQSSQHHGTSYLQNTQRRKMRSSSALFQSNEDGEENGSETTDGMSTATATANAAVANNNNNNNNNNLANNRQRNKDWIHDDICR
eukprot:scaffold181510_cov35-Attheya_sp.AAC.1